MKHLIAIACALVGSLDLQASQLESPRFVAIDVYLESPHSVAAWQFEVSARNGEMKLVGIEGGSSEHFRGAPFYDREILRGSQTDKILVADYSLADEALLPIGRFRIATLHLMLLGEADLDAALMVTTTSEGESISASLELVQSNQESKER